MAGTPFGAMLAADCRLEINNDFPTEPGFAACPAMRYEELTSSVEARRPALVHCNQKC